MAGKGGIPVVQQNRDIVGSVIRGCQVQVPIRIQISAENRPRPPTDRMERLGGKGAVPVVQQNRDIAGIVVCSYQVKVPIPIQISRE